MRTGRFLSNKLYNYSIGDDELSLEKLQEFISTKSKNEEDKEVDWEERKNDWIKSVENLYSNMEKWVKPLIDKGQIEIKHTNVTLNEEYIGEYGLKNMQIFISNEKIELIPVGTLIIGSHGRIDMIGKNGKMRLLLVNKNAKSISVISTESDATYEKENNLEDKEEIELVWKIATSPPNIKLLSLNDDSFSDILLEMIK